MRTISVVRGGRSLQHRLRACAAAGRARAVLAQLGEVLVAEHLALLVHHAVPVEEAERRPQPPVVDELHDRVELVEPVLQRRAGEHQREPRLEALDARGWFSPPSF